jgi:predicted metal-dependent peptidase
MIFLADVSGSMKEKSIFGIINDLSIRVKRLGLKEVKLITWNTDKVQEITLDDFKTLKQGLRIGGGTELAEGIKYINSFNKDNYPVIVISDLEDNLSEWNREFLKNNSPNYVVSVGKNSRRSFSHLDKSIKIYESDYL